jgi:hypothetical protein
VACRVELFCEDSAHESCARAIVGRIATELGVSVSIHTASAKLGIGRLKTELAAFHALVRRRAGTPDLLVVVVDANAVGPQARRREVEELVDASVFPRHVIGTPDPCVERWLLADPEAFAERFGVQPPLAAVRDRRDWKRRLQETLERAGEIVTQGGGEFADDIIETLDFYRARQADPTIQTFADDLRAALKQIAG